MEKLRHRVKVITVKRQRRKTSSECLLMRTALFPCSFQQCWPLAAPKLSEHWLDAAEGKMVARLEGKPQRVSGIQGIRMTEVLKYWMCPKYSWGPDGIRVIHHWRCLLFAIQEEVWVRRPPSSSQAQRQINEEKRLREPNRPTVLLMEKD